MIISTLELEQPYRGQLDELTGGQVRHTRLDQLSENELRSVEILFTYGYDIPEATLRRMTSLHWVHIGQSGMDKLPMAALSEMGITLTNSRGINSVAISEYVMAMMLNVVRQNDAFYEAQKAGRWDLDTRLDELCGKTVGILGLGKVGAEIARRASAFDMRVLGMDVRNEPLPNIEKIFLPAEKDALLAQCDFVVICMPLTPQTHRLIDAAALKRMRSSAWLINVGRGPIVDESALIDALQSKTIAGAVLDVFETEPLPADHPLWRLPNVRVTPHIAGDHLASYMPRMMAILSRNYQTYPDLAAMLNPVDVRRGF